jgi:hypothetical protein
VRIKPEHALGFVRSRQESHWTMSRRAIGQPESHETQRCSARPLRQERVAPAWARASAAARDPVHPSVQWARLDQNHPPGEARLKIRLEILPGNVIRLEQVFTYSHQVTK